MPPAILTNNCHSVEYATLYSLDHDKPGTIRSSIVEILMRYSVVSSIPLLKILSAAGPIHGRVVTNSGLAYMGNENNVQRARSKQRTI